MVVGYAGILVLVAILGLAIAGIVVVFLLVSRNSNPSHADNPNLAPCPDCGRAISIRATTCPHCGGPVQLK